MKKTNKKKETGKKTRITCVINKKIYSFNVHPMMRALDLIREEAELTGTKEGCGAGECGACSIILDGKLVNSCLIPAIDLDGGDILTVEGISEKNKLSKIQKSFLERGGAQCGFCTPGMIMASYDLLKRYKNPTLKDVKEGLSGNICRCTGYTKIFDAVLSMKKIMKK